MSRLVWKEQVSDCAYCTRVPPTLTIARSTNGGHCTLTRRLSYCALGTRTQIWWMGSLALGGRSLSASV